MKSHHIGLGVLSVAMVAALTGCGGGGNGPTTPSNTPTPQATSTPIPANQRFNGQYTGNFAGITTQGNKVQGTFNNTVSGAGQIAGTIAQAGFPNFTATGTIDTNGAISATAPIPNGTVSTVTGTATLTNNSSITSGSLITSSGTQTFVTGIFAGARAEATANPYAGNYTGTFNGGINNQGTFTLAVDANGAASGTFNQRGLGQHPAVGTIDRAGNLSVRAIIALPIDNSTILLTTLTGKGTLNHGAVTITGTFNRTANDQQNASGTFTATRN